MLGDMAPYPPRLVSTVCGVWRQLDLSARLIVAEHCGTNWAAWTVPIIKRASERKAIGVDHLLPRGTLALRGLPNLRATPLARPARAVEAAAGPIELAFPVAFRECHPPRASSSQQGAGRLYWNRLSITLRLRVSFGLDVVVAVTPDTA